MKFVLLLGIALSVAPVFGAAAAKGKGEVTTSSANRQQNQLKKYHIGPNGYTGGQNCYEEDGRRAHCSQCGLATTSSNSLYNCK